MYTNWSSRAFSRIQERILRPLRFHSSSIASTNQIHVPHLQPKDTSNPLHVYALCHIDKTGQTGGELIYSPVRASAPCLTNNSARLEPKSSSSVMLQNNQLFRNTKDRQPLIAKIYGSDKRPNKHPLSTFDSGESPTRSFRHSLALSRLLSFDLYFTRHDPVLDNVGFPIALLITGNRFVEQRCQESRHLQCRPPLLYVKYFSGLCIVSFPSLYPMPTSDRPNQLSDRYSINGKSTPGCARHDFRNDGARNGKSARNFGNYVIACICNDEVPEGGALLILRLVRLVPGGDSAVLVGNGSYHQ